MSLVSYANSSDDEDSDYEAESNSIKVKIVNAAKIKFQPTTASSNHDHISDEDDYTSEAAPFRTLKKTPFTLLLPQPKNTESRAQNLKGFMVSTFAKLPTPKLSGCGFVEIVEEKDDEFLRKKPMPSVYGSKEKTSPPTTSKGPVKIVIPSLDDFIDVDRDLANIKNKNVPANKRKGCGLLSILPKAKSKQNFARTIATSVYMSNASDDSRAFAHSFVPDTVKNSRPALNTENVDVYKYLTITNTKRVRSTEKAKVAEVVDCSDSEEDEHLDRDFFSLNAAAEQLPEISSNEINAMVAKRVAKMAAVKTKYLLGDVADKAEPMQQDSAVATGDDLGLPAQKRYHDQQLNPDALQSLIGSSAKRRRGGREQQQSEIQIVDISSADILPNRDEWMRTALASSTSYQPTGVLTDDEPAAGTRRKHQITYLAHKAKSNEAELQEMWAANRQNRRAAQSKYGF